MRPRLLIPLAALLAVMPLILHGGSCGHDEVFHVQGWYDAAAQLRHFHYPHWSFTSAWNAGEPRFIFYPPLSWLLGAVLTLILPPQMAVYAFIFLCLTLSGFAMYRLAGHFTNPSAARPTSFDPALIAAILYLANPYMLFNAFERSAFAELLAAAWIPLLLLAVLRTRPTIAGIAVPLALLWLTNAPAAVMASYAFALVATLRFIQLIFSTFKARRSGTPFSYVLSPLSPAFLARTYTLGALLGLALPAFYLIPAAYERRFVQVALAIIPNMRIQDNFFFEFTADPGHNGVNHQISLLGLTLLILTILAVTTLLVFRRATDSNISANTEQVPRGFSLGVPGPVEKGALAPGVCSPSPAVPLAVLTAALTLMLFPISLPLWNHIPELSFLQFPWRLLTLLSAVLAFALALVIHRLPNSRRTTHSPLPSPLSPLSLPSILCPLLSALLGFTAFHLYSQFCQPADRPAAIAQNLRTHHGFPPTDEYTPNSLNALKSQPGTPTPDDPDSDVLRTDNPGYWLAPASAPNTPAPGTLPTAAELNPNLQTDDTPVPLAQSISASAPQHLTLALPEPETLVLNLRNYIDWRITRRTLNGQTVTIAQRLQRDDGLVAIPLPAGPSTIDIAWRTAPDQLLGLALSITALLILLALMYRNSTARQP